MKSNKVKDTIGHLKERFLKFVFTEEALQRMQAEKQLSQSEKKELIKQKRKNWIISALGFLTGLVIMVCIGMVLDRCIPKDETNKTENTNTVKYQVVKLPEGERDSIVSGQQKKYMIDKLNSIYLKTAYTEVDGKVAYSVTYNNDNTPQGEVVYTHFLKDEKVTTILLNGYPYKSYEDMGLQNEEEAYIATQLAVYEMISRQQVSGIANGTFSLSEIKASEEQYKEMVDRVLNKANEMVTFAIENTYENTNKSSFDTKSVDVVDEGNETLIGPFYTHTIPDKYLEMYLDESYRFTTKFNATSFYEDSEVYTCDKDGNKLSEIETGKAFYVKVIGNERYFAQLNVSVYSKIIYTRIYSGGTNQKKYAVLSDKNNIAKTVTALEENVKTRDVKISFLNDAGEKVTELKYKLYNEDGKVLQDNDGYSGWNEYRLPLGKYYVEIYDVPDEYFLNSNRYDIDLTKEGDMIELEIKVDSLEAFLNN